jgi:hypothetical protein
METGIFIQHQNIFVCNSDISLESIIYMGLRLKSFHSINFLSHHPQFALGVGSGFGGHP